MVNVSPADPPDALTTATEAVPGFASKFAGTTAWSDVPFMKVVTRAVLSGVTDSGVHVTIEADEKFVPVT